MNTVCKISFLVMFGLFTNNFSVYPVSADQAYYKTNKWAFLEDKLVDRVDYARPNNARRLLLSAFIGLSIGSITAGICAQNEMDSNSMALYGWTGGITSFILAAFYLLCNEYEIPIFENFLKSYDTDLNNSDPNNFKLYVPEELHETFDILYEGYKQHGVEYLNNEGRRVLRRLMWDVKYKINPNKYIKQTPDVYVTTYPIVIGR